MPPSTKSCALEHTSFARFSPPGTRPSHDVLQPLDYFVWLIRNAGRTVVVDVGFSADMARQRKRTFLRTPSEGLALLGVEAATVKNVRAMTAGRTKPWTNDELMALMPGGRQQR